MVLSLIIETCGYNSNNFESDVDVYIGDLELREVIVGSLRELNESKKSSNKKREKRVDRFSPSQIAYECHRRIYFDMIYPRTADDASLGTFVLGDAIHSVIQSILESRGAVSNVSCGKSYEQNGSSLYINGECDSLIEKDCGIEINDIVLSDLVTEIKTVSPFAWKYIVGGVSKGEAIIGSPKKSHVNQLNTYLDLLDKDEGLLLYVNKDNLSIYSYHVRRDNSIMEQTLSRCFAVRDLIVSKTVPAKHKSNECSYCNHKDLCKKEK